MYGDDDFTPAHHAATTGDLQLLVKAIKQDPSVIQQRDADGYTPLSHAVLAKHTSIVKRLVKMGADVNIQDDSGRTCLSVAAYQGWSDGVIYLLRKGARPDIVDKSGRTPLHAATYDTDTRSLIAILKRLDAPDEINIGDNERMTALHWASFHDRPDHVRQLLQRGATCTLTDIDGKTPLHWAAQNGSAGCCVVLLEENADLLTAIDNSGKTAVHLAAAAGHSNIVHDLASIAPATSEAPDKDSRTPLHWAAATGKAGCVRALLNLNVPRDPHDMDGVTPLEYATNAGHEECVKLLQEKPNSKSLPKGSKTDDKNSKTGFFRGLFSRKKSETVNEQTKLPDVVQHKHPGKIDASRDLNKESSFISDVSSRPDHVLRINSTTPLPDGVPYLSGENRNIYTVRNLEGISAKEKLSDSLKKGAAKKKKKKRRHKLSDEGGSTRTSSSINDNSSRSSPIVHKHLTPLDALSHSRLLTPSGPASRDSSVRRPVRDLSPIHTEKNIHESAGKSKSLKTKNKFGPDPSRTSPQPPLPYSITGKIILPEIRTGSSGSLVENNSRRDTKHKKKSGVGIYTPQDRGREEEI